MSSTRCLIATIVPLGVLSGCAALPKDYAYRDLECAHRAVSSKEAADVGPYLPPNPEEYESLHRRIKKGKYLWPYAGVDMLFAIPPPPVPQGEKPATPPAPWPIRLAVVTYAHNQDYCNCFTGAEECMFLDNGFENLVPVMAAHGLYWDLRRSGRFEAVHFQPDSIADYDVVFHVDHMVQKDAHMLVVRWFGEMDGQAEAKVAKVKKTPFTQQLQESPEDAYDDLSDAISAAGSRVSAALGQWLRATSPQKLALARARHDINYFHYFDEHFSELNRLLEAAATPEAQSQAREEVEHRRIVLQTSRSIERQMCATASVAKRDYLLTQLQAKEPIDAELVAYNQQIKKQKRRQHGAEAGMFINSFAGGFNQGMNQAMYQQTGNPYYLSQAQQIQWQTAQINQQLIQVADQARRRAEQIKIERNTFAARVIPEMETAFKDSPYSDFLRAFFKQVDFSSVQRMRVTTREAYLRTFSWDAVSGAGTEAPKK